MFKKISKKIFTVMSTLMLTLIPLLNVKALPQSINLGPAPGKTKQYIAGVNFNYKVTTDGKYLYCLNIHKSVAQNVQANLVQNNKYVDGGVYYILKNGYPYKSITGDKDKDYYITQTAVWWYLDTTTGSDNLGEQFKSKGSDAYGLRSKVKSLVDEGVAHKGDKIPGLTQSKLTISTTDSTMTLQDDYYVSKTIQATGENITKYKVSLTNAPEGTVIERQDYSIVNANQDELDINDKFRIKIPVSKVTTQDLTVKVEAKATGNTQYEIGEYQPVNESMQPVALMTSAQQTVTSNLSLTISTTRVSITKVDKVTGQPLAGAVLALQDDKGNELTRWTSTLNAHIIKNLENGTYNLVEISAPEGYSVNKNSITFKITDTNKNFDIKFENQPKKVVVNITKVDQSTNQPLAGATMQIKNSKGEIVYKFVTTTTAEVITDIEYGTYTLEEVAAPEGYIKNDKIITFTIDDDHQSHQITFENAKEVHVPDTASASSIMLVIGLIISGLGFAYIKKHA